MRPNVPQQSLANRVKAKLVSAFARASEEPAPGADSTATFILDAYKRPQPRPFVLQAQLTQPASRPQQPAKRTLPSACYALVVAPGTRPTRHELELVAAAYESRRDAKKSEIARRALEQYERINEALRNGTLVLEND